MKTAILILTTTLTTIGSGCMSHYRHGVVNVGDHALYAVNVKSGKYTYGHGFVISGARSVYGSDVRIHKSPPPVVCWRNSGSGPDICQEVEIDSAQGRGKILYFVMDGETVRATYTLPPLPKMQPYKSDEPADYGICTVFDGDCVTHGDECLHREEHIQSWKRAQNPPPVEYRKDPNAKRTP